MWANLSEKPDQKDNMSEQLNDTSSTNLGSSSSQPASPNLGGSTGQGGVSDAGAAGAGSPTIFDLSDDSLVRVKGQGEPVKFGELSKRQQADYTRKTQQAQQLQATAARERQQLAAERSRLEGIAASLVQRQQGRGGEQVDPFMAELGAAEFIDGKTAVKLVQALQSGGFEPIANAIKERDKVISQLYQHVVQLSNTVKEMGGRFGQTDFDGKINRWLEEGGYPAEAADLAKEIYLAYEGEDLDNEFPQIFQQRWNQIQSILDKQRQAKVEAARRQPMLPGRGGNGAASKPIGLKGNENAKTLADTLWDAMQAGEQT